MSYVYFIRQADTGFIKIGRAADPWRRLPNIQVGSPQQLTLLGVVKEHGAFTESDLHDAFNVHHFRGEWFREAGSLAEVIKSHLPWFINETTRLQCGHEIDSLTWRRKFSGLITLARTDEELKLYKNCLDCNERKHYRNFYFRQKIPLSYCKACQRLRVTTLRLKKQEVALAAH